MQLFLRTHSVSVSDRCLHIKKKMDWSLQITLHRSKCGHSNRNLFKRVINVHNLINSSLIIIILSYAIVLLIRIKPSDTMRSRGNQNNLTQTNKCVNRHRNCSFVIKRRYFSNSRRAEPTKDGFVIILCKCSGG